MNKIDLIPRIKELHEKGINIIEFLKKEEGRELNTLDDILISYDFQAGSYIKYTQENPSYNNLYTSAIAGILAKFEPYASILEVGVGEATTLGNIASKIDQRDNKKFFFGLDISWSRINCAISYLRQKEISADLFVADLFNIPLNDSSIDIIYTSHSIEPNGGREKEALKELYRVSRKYLVLLEPTNEFADEAGRSRMKKNGYIQNLAEIIAELKYNLIEYRLFDVSANHLNPTGLYIIKKESVESNDPFFCCPISKSRLKEYNDHYFSKESLLSYPKINSIPCLCPSYGILTSKHE